MSIPTTGPRNKARHILTMLLSEVLLSLCVGCQYNPQQTDSSPLIGTDALALGRIPTPDSWSEYTLNSAFMLSIPDSLEQSNPDDKYSQSLRAINLERSNGIVFFQPKYLNRSPIEKADDHYCRVIVKHEKYGADAKLLHYNETQRLDGQMRSELFDNVISNLDSRQQLLTSPTYNWVDIDGTKAIQVKYRRTGNKGNTTACTMYYLFNYDEMVLVMTAYREQEAELWQEDMENVIRTFRWSHPK